MSHQLHASSPTKSPEGAHLGKQCGHGDAELLLWWHNLTCVFQGPRGTHTSMLPCGMRAHTVLHGMKTPGVLMGCMHAWSPVGCQHLASLWDAGMHGLPWDAHTYGPPWDTGIWGPCGMHAHTVPCGTQAGVLGTPKGPPFHQAKCYRRATTCPWHKSLPVTHQAACPLAHGPSALPGLPGSTQGHTCPAVAQEGAQMPAQPFGPLRTRWDQITSKSEILITHVLCGCRPPLVAWVCPCR